MTDKPTPYYIVPHYNNKGVFDGYELNVVAYSNFLKDHFHVVYFKNTLFIYDDAGTVYREACNEIQTHIRDTLIEFGIDMKLLPAQKELLTHLQSMGCYYRYPFNRGTDDIPVSNGVIRIDYDAGVVTLLPHGAEHMFTFKLPTKYDPDVPTTIATDLLGLWVDNVDRLLQIPSQSLIQMQTGGAYKKAHLIQGGGDNGKSGYVVLNRRFFGVENTSSVSLHQMNESRFALSELEGKLLNIFDELLNVALDTVENFKIITGDTSIRIEQKYKQGYTAYLPAANVFTCNHAPEVPEKIRRDFAFWRRWEFIKFERVFPLNPNFYDETFTDEFMSSYLNAILQAMIRMKRKGDLLVMSDVQKVMADWSIDSDPMYQFLQWGFVAGTGKIRNRYSKAKLHRAYLRWCKDHNIADYKIKNTLTGFSQSIQTHGVYPVQREEKGINYEVYETSDWELNRGVISELSYHNDTPVMDIPISNAQTLGV